MPAGRCPAGAGALAVRGTVAAGGTALDPEVVAQLLGGQRTRHINNLFRKLDLAESPDDNRRVLAVLAYLNESDARA